jgi:3-phenylpropionate/trans-cinnamate dioxygenase ferredoxin subunit
MRFLVAPVSEFPPGSRRVVRVGGREIGVFRVDEKFYAVRNRCPHQGGPLCLGFIRRRIISDEPGVIRVADGPPLVVCPWHAWQYDALTGEAYAPGDSRARSYQVEVERGSALAKEADEPSESGVKFVAETFPVSVENDYVVLDV